MKECTYGWYPPARNILQNYEGKLPMTSYTKECFYQHPKSRYADAPGINTPEDPLIITGSRSPKQVPKYKSWSRASSPQRPRSQDQGRNTTLNLEIRGVSQSCKTPDHPQKSRPASVSSDVRMFAPSPPHKSRLASAQKAWSMNIPETKIPDLQDYLRECAQKQPMDISGNTPDPMATPDFRKTDNFRPHIPRTPDRSDLGTSSTERRERVKSATTYRPRYSAPRRPVKSAGPVRTPIIQMPTCETRESYTDHDMNEYQDDYRREEPMDFETFQLRKTSPDPPKSPDLFPVHYDVPPPDPDKEELGVDFPVDYDEQLKKYGWRMQVHGDPLNLKRLTIGKRLAYTVQLPEPEIAPNPPKARAENYDTYYYNTIPRKPLSFTIHQEWPSEVLLAKRMELQKRDGSAYKYRTKNFAFIY